MFLLFISFISYISFFISFADGLFSDSVGAEIIGLAADGLLSGGHGALVMLARSGRPEIIGLAADGLPAGLLFAVRAEIIFKAIQGLPAFGHGPL